MRFLWILTLPLLAASCGPLPLTAQPSPTISLPAFSTPTLASTATPRPSPTLAPATLAPTGQPVEGTVSAQINVRAAPGRDAPALGLLNPGFKVQIIGRDADADWWHILYEQAPNGLGWVSADYVTTTAPLTDIPVTVREAVASPSQPPAASFSPVPTDTPAVIVKTGVTTVLVNVRAGPGSTFDSLGMLQPNTPVTLTGRNETSAWLQIEYPASTGQKGWLAALYLRVEVGLDGLPYYDNQGNLKGLATPAATLGPSPTATILSPAAVDQDSRERPAASVAFSPETTRIFTYTNDLSAPGGDSDDWLAFIPYSLTSGEATYVYISLKCEGNGNITPALRVDGAPVGDFRGFTCGMYDVAVRVLGGKTYLLGLTADGSATDLRYVRYELTIAMNP